MEQLPLPLAVTPGGQRAEGPLPNPSAPTHRAAPTRNDAAPPARSGDVRRCDPADMALRGRIGAYRLHATHDPRETTKKARERFLERFEREVDPDGVLTDDERQRRAAYARKAYFAQLARARNARKAGRRHHRGSGQSEAGNRADPMDPIDPIHRSDGGETRRAA